MGLSRFSIDWRRVSRWSLWGAAILCVYLLWPAARCTWHGFVDEPLPGVEHQRGLDDGDVAAREEPPGFFAGFFATSSACYRALPISAQAAWKRNLLYSLLVLGIGAALAHRMSGRTHDGY